MDDSNTLRALLQQNETQQPAVMRLPPHVNPALLAQLMLHAQQRTAVPPAAAGMASPPTHSQALSAFVCAGGAMPHQQLNLLLLADLQWRLLQSATGVGAAPLMPPLARPRAPSLFPPTLPMPPALTPGALLALLQSPIKPDPIVSPSAPQSTTTTSLTTTHDEAPLDMSLKVSPSSQSASARRSRQRRSTSRAESTVSTRASNASAFQVRQLGSLAQWRSQR